jgi:hypothetical protein
LLDRECEQRAVIVAEEARDTDDEKNEALALWMGLSGRILISTTRRAVVSCPSMNSKFATPPKHIVAEPVFHYSVRLESSIVCATRIHRAAWRISR